MELGSAVWSLLHPTASSCFSVDYQSYDKHSPPPSLRSAGYCRKIWPAPALSAASAGNSVLSLGFPRSCYTAPPDPRSPAPPLLPVCDPCP
uniref:Putative secreted protein n=1 Tax=Anopheles triannulatus TaxID=58253 RepID=A0A2M4B3F5_9DIPT